MNSIYTAAGPSVLEIPNRYVSPKSALGNFVVPATAFVYAIRDGVAYLITSAHVIGPDMKVEFQVAPGRTYPAVNHDVQTDDRNHGLGWLSVQNPPAAVQALPYTGAKPAAGDDVRFAGYPAPSGRFSQM